MPKRIMREFALFEVSAVDRPCQEGARMVIAKRAPCKECGGNGSHLEKCSMFGKAQWGEEGNEFVHIKTSWSPLDTQESLAYMKRTFTQAQRDEAERKGESMAGGGFPVANESDLRNAIRAIGRAKNPAAARAHIKTRAKSLGLSDMIPDTWKAAPAVCKECGGKDGLHLEKCITAKVFRAYQMGEKTDAPALEQFQPLLKLAAAYDAPTLALAPIYAAIVKAAPEIDALPDGERAETLDGLMVKCAEKLAKIVPAGSVDAFKAAIAAKGEGPMDPKELEKLQKRAAFLELLAKASDAVKAFMAAEKMDDAAQAGFLAKSADEQAAAMKAKKPPPKDDCDDQDEDDMKKALKKRDTVIADLTKNLNVLQAKDELAVCKEICRKAGVAEGKADLLVKLRKLDDKTIAEETLKEWASAAKQTNPMLFAELGKGGGSGNDDPTVEIMTKAAEIRTAINKAAKPHEQITIEKARVLAREQFPDLAKAEREIEQRRRMGRAA